MSWAKVHRQLFESPLWLSEKFTRGQAWLDLFTNANYADGYIRVRGARIEIKRGQIGWSQLTMGRRWQWSRGKVQRFLVELEDDGMIVHRAGQHTTITTICNYSTYQDQTNDNDTTNGT